MCDPEYKHRRVSWVSQTIVTWLELQSWGLYPPQLLSLHSFICTPQESLLLIIWRCFARAACWQFLFYPWASWCLRLVSLPGKYFPSSLEVLCAFLPSVSREFAFISKAVWGYFFLCFRCLQQIYTFNTKKSQASVKIKSWAS